MLYYAGAIMINKKDKETKIDEINKVSFNVTREVFRMNLLINKILNKDKKKREDGSLVF